MRNNRINNIKSLSSLSNLKSLDISNNDISDTSPIRSLPELSLTNIEFSGNPLPKFVYANKLNQEFILSTLSPYIESAIKQFYGEYRQYMSAGILGIEKTEGKYRLKIRVETFVGPHNPP